MTRIAWRLKGVLKHSVEVVEYVNEYPVEVQHRRVVSGPGEAGGIPWQGVPPVAQTSRAGEIQQGKAFITGWSERPCRAESRDRADWPYPANGEESSRPVPVLSGVACRPGHGGNPAAGMQAVERQQGSRRLNLPVDFPLVDSEGICVVRCRRRLPDRRRAKPGLEDYSLMIVRLGGRLV